MPIVRTERLAEQYARISEQFDATLQHRPACSISGDDPLLNKAPARQKISPEGG
jgi:hypothetical protein